MYPSFFALALFLILFTCQTRIEEELPVREPAESARYSPSDMQKMRWLAGAWKGVEAGRTLRQSFQFHGGNALEILSVENSGEMSTCSLVWHEGRYYYGLQRQWIVTWIGDKDVRFEPVRAGLSPMTWTRLNNHTWHIVRHSPGGDETTVMESVEGMQP